MTWKSLLPAAAGLLLMTVVGCQSPQQYDTRGQNPDASVVNSGTSYGGQQVVQGCPDGRCGHPGCQTCNQEKGHGHYHWTYTPPQGLSYPQGASGVVFYPYYTLKGPDDFFYTGE